MEDKADRRIQPKSAASGGRGDLPRALRFEADDMPALAVGSRILAGGESSRLYQSLVYRQQIAQQATFSADLNEELGLLTVALISRAENHRSGGESA